MLLEQQIVELDLRQLYQMQLLAGNYPEAIESIRNLRQSEKLKRANAKADIGIRHELYALAKLEKLPFDAAYRAAFNQRIGKLENVAAQLATEFVARDYERDRSFAEFAFGRVSGLNLKDESASARNIRSLLWMMSAYLDYLVGGESAKPLAIAVKADREKRYFIDTKVLITTKEGIELSAMVVRDKTQISKRPSILTATIYSDEKMNLQRAIEAAAHGYVGVVSDSRGKRLSSSQITPYENEPEDVTAVIDWISRQSWSDGRVGMYGGSYLGYTQWAAAKKMHPALKTIVPSVAVIPGQGLPMENNIPLLANYAWTEFVSTGKYNYNQAYSGYDWFDIYQQWFKSGRAFNEFDQVVGKENPWFQKWLAHPGFDQFWQKMVPYKQEYAKIDIPVLSLTGYYDDAQISAIEFVKDHFKYHKNPNHYLVIGPYDHFNVDIAQSTDFRGYQIDDVAHIDLRRLTFQWFNYIFNRGKKPEILKDKINYQLMDDNSWRHAPSIKALNEKGKNYYLTTQAENAGYLLSPTQESKLGALTQTVDLKDRTITHNNHYYPFPVERKSLDVETGYTFVTEAFDKDMELSGTISGELKVKTNKKDFDFGLVLFELKADGSLHHLNYYLGRASFSHDRTTRQLLQPNTLESIPFERARMISKKIAKGSRLMLLVDVNVNDRAQINYGTGKDVAKENISDAKEPLVIEWNNSSYIKLPLSVYQK